MNTLLSSLILFASSVHLSALPGLNGAVKLFVFATPLVAFPRRTSIQQTEVWLFVIAAWMTLTYLYAGIYLYEHNDDSAQRLRYWLLEAAFAVGSSSIVVALKRSHGGLVSLLRVVRLSIAVHAVLGVYQLAIEPNEAGRIAYLYAEPSMAAGGLFFHLVCYQYLTQTLTGRFRSADLAFFSLLLVEIIATGSKAVLPAIAIYSSYLLLTNQLAFTKRQLATVVALTLAIGVIFQRELSNSFLALVNVVVALHSAGLSGLDYSYLVWDSFITRISGWIVSIELLTRHVLMGIGPGGFDHLFTETFTNSPIAAGAVELEGILSGSLYATPKSYFLEFLLSLGIVGFAFLVKLAITLARAARVNCIPAMIILGLGFTLELAPYLQYFIVASLLCPINTRTDMRQLTVPTTLSGRA